MSSSAGGVGGWSFQHTHGSQISIGQAGAATLSPTHQGAQSGGGGGNTVTLGSFGRRTTFLTAGRVNSVAATEESATRASQGATTPAGTGVALRDPRVRVMCVLLDHRVRLVRQYHFLHSEADMLGAQMQLHAADASVWLDRRARYTRLLATWSIVQYLLGATERSPQHIFLNPTTGNLQHFELGQCSFLPLQGIVTPHHVLGRLPQATVPATTNTPQVLSAADALVAKPWVTPDPSVFRCTPLFVNALPLRSAFGGFSGYCARFLTRIYHYRRDLCGLLEFSLGPAAIGVTNDAVALSTPNVLTPLTSFVQVPAAFSNATAGGGGGASPPATMSPHAAAQVASRTSLTGIRTAAQNSAPHAPALVEILDAADVLSYGALSGSFANLAGNSTGAPPVTLEILRLAATIQPVGCLHAEPGDRDRFHLNAVIARIMESLPIHVRRFPPFHQSRSQSAQPGSPTKRGRNGAQHNQPPKSASATTLAPTESNSLVASPASPYPASMMLAAGSSTFMFGDPAATATQPDAVSDSVDAMSRQPTRCATADVSVLSAPSNALDVTQPTASVSSSTSRSSNGSFFSTFVSDLKTTSATKIQALARGWLARRRGLHRDLAPDSNLTGDVQDSDTAVATPTVSPRRRAALTEDVDSTVRNSPLVGRSRLRASAKDASDVSSSGFGGGGCGDGGAGGNRGPGRGWSNGAATSVTDAAGAGSGASNAAGGGGGMSPATNTAVAIELLQFNQIDQAAEKARTVQQRVHAMIMAATSEYHQVATSNLTAALASIATSSSTGAVDGSDGGRVAQVPLVVDHSWVLWAPHW